MNTVRIIVPGRDFRYQAKHPLDVAEVLANHGYRVEVVSPMPPDVAAFHYGRGFDLVRLPAIVSSIVPGSQSIEYLTAALLRGLGWADITIGVDAPGFMVAHLLKRLKRTRVLIYYAMELCLPEETPAQETVQYQARHIREADLVITTGEHRAQILYDRFGLRQMSLVVRNSLVWKQPLPRAKLRPRLTEQGFAPPQYLVIYQGWLAEETAIPEIIRSVREWPLNSALVLMGFGPSDFVRNMPDYVRAFGVENRVFYLGTVPSDPNVLFELIAGADIGLALRKYRGMILNNQFSTPGKLAEYMAMGVPVVCSDQASLRFVEDEGWGLCVDPEDSSGIARAVSEILSVPERRQVMAQTARQLFDNKYCMERQVEPLLAVLDDWAIAARRTNRHDRSSHGKDR